MAHGQLTKNHTHHCYILLEKLNLHNEIIRVIFLHMWAALLSMGTTKCRPIACMEWWPARYRLQRLQWRGSSVQSLGCVASVAGRRCLQPGFLPAHQAYLIHTTGKQQGQAFPALPVLLSPSIKDHNALGPSAGTNTAITHLKLFCPKSSTTSQPAWHVTGNQGISIFNRPGCARMARTWSIHWPCRGTRHLSQ